MVITKVNTHFSKQSDKKWKCLRAVNNDKSTIINPNSIYLKPKGQT